jgi:hypothetical protein
MPHPILKMIVVAALNMSITKNYRGEMRIIKNTRNISLL